MSKNFGELSAEEQEQILLSRQNMPLPVTSDELRKQREDFLNKKKPLPPIPSTSSPSEQENSEIENDEMGPNQPKLKGRFSIGDLVNDKENWKTLGKTLAGMVAIGILGTILMSFFPPIGLIASLISTVVIGVGIKKIYNKTMANKMNRLQNQSDKNSRKNKSQNRRMNEQYSEISQEKEQKVSEKDKENPEKPISKKNPEAKKDNNIPENKILSPKSEKNEKNNNNKKAKDTEKNIKNPELMHNAKIAGKYIGGVTGIIILAVIITSIMPISVGLVAAIATAGSAALVGIAGKKIFQNIRGNNKQQSELSNNSEHTHPKPKKPLPAIPTKPFIAAGRASEQDGGRGI